MWLVKLERVKRQNFKNVTLPFLPLDSSYVFRVFYVKNICFPRSCSCSGLQFGSLKLQNLRYSVMTLKMIFFDFHDTLNQNLAVVTNLTMYVKIQVQINKLKNCSGEP